MNYIENQQVDVDQLIVRIWKACNFKCTFCNVDYNEKHVLFKEDIMDIVRNFHYKFKYSNVSSWKIIITISWWEPSLFHKEVIFILKYINNFLKRKYIEPIFDIQTNASNISLDFAKKIKDLWVSKAMISFHTNDKKKFDNLIWVNYDIFFSKLDEGIKLLHKAWINIETNTIISNINKDNFFDNIKYLYDNYPYIDVFNIWVVQPHWYGYKNFEKIAVQYGEISYIYNKVIYFLNSKWKNISSHFTWLPACYIDKKKYYLEWEENTFIRKTLFKTNKNLINDLNDSNKIQTKKCVDCIYNNICSWIWKEYENYQILKPFNYKKVFEKDYCDFLVNTNEDIWKLFSKWVKNVIIKTSNKNYKNLISKSLERSFFKITLYIDEKVNIDYNLLKSGMWNIQININNISLEEINSILKFSEKYQPQYWVNLDLLIYDFSNEIVSKINFMYLNKYLSLYFIYNFYKKNTEVYNYNYLLYELGRNINIKTINFNKNFIYKNNNYVGC